MIYIIDACNLIFTIDEYGKLVDQNNFEDARFNLLAMLSCFSTDTNNKVIAFFDGALPGLPFGRHQKHGPVDVIYSLPNQTADILIEAKVLTFGRGECTVVTSDVNLRDNCLEKGAKVIPCESFPPPKGLADFLTSF